MRGKVKFMKRKYIAFLLGTALCFSMFQGCGKMEKGIKEKYAVSEQEENKDIVYGQVSQLTENTITIQVGTRKNRKALEKEVSGQMDGGENSEGQREKGKIENPKENGTAGQPQEIPSILELTGEEQQIQVTQNTTYKRQTMGHGENMADGRDISKQPDGEAPGNGGMPNRQDGEMPGDGEMPKQPDGEMPGDGEMPKQPDGEGQSENISISDISKGDTIMVTLKEDGSANEVTVMSKMGGDQQNLDSPPENYAAVKEYYSDVSLEGDTITSKGTDENAILVSEKATAEFKNISVFRESEDSTGGDNSSFYGVGAAVLAKDGNIYISDSTIETNAAGGAGIFAYEKGTVYTASTSVTAQQNTSGGIHVAGGGKLYAWDMEVETNGESAAAIRSDRGGGTMVVDGGNYTSNGVGSPAIYSTADIAINNAKLTANGSEAVCIEGLNSIHLYNSQLTGTMGMDERNDCTWNVILYQSMSGDSKIGNSTFEMQGGSLKANHGGMFYTTNTESTIMLSNVTIDNAKDSNFFLKCTGNQNQRGWGTAGSNGADCLFTADNQIMEGNVIWDSISQLDFYIKENSQLTGAVVQDESAAGSGGEGWCNLYLGEGCTWTVTADSTLSALASEGSIVDEKGNTVTVQNTDRTIYVKGTSNYTITVENYDDTANFSEAAKTTEWGNYQIEKPKSI